MELEQIVELTVVEQILELRSWCSSWSSWTFLVMVLVVLVVVELMVILELRAELKDAAKTEVEKKVDKKGDNKFLLQANAEELTVEALRARMKRLGRSTGGSMGGPHRTSVEIHVKHAKTTRTSKDKQGTCRNSKEHQ